MPDLVGDRLLATVGMVIADPDENDRIGTPQQHAYYVLRLRRMLHTRRDELRELLAKDVRRKGKRTQLTPKGQRCLAWYLA